MKNTVSTATVNTLKMNPPTLPVRPSTVPNDRAIRSGMEAMYCCICGS